MMGKREFICKKNLKFWLEKILFCLQNLHFDHTWWNIILHPLPHMYIHTNIHISLSLSFSLSFSLSYTQKKE